jgi:hypothetical protein
MIWKAKWNNSKPAKTNICFDSMIFSMLIFMKG